MLKDITIGQYIPGNSFLHKSDPRTKIILSVLYMIIVFLIDSYGAFAMLAFFTLAVIISCGIPLLYTIRGLKPVLFIVVFTSILNIFYTQSGTMLFEYKFIHITDQGILTAVKIALRLTLFVMGGTLLTFTTTPISLTDGLEKLMKPLKHIGVPAHEIAMMMSIAIRFIPTLMDETDKIMKAQSARGADFDTGNIIQRAKSFIPVLVPLLVSAFRRATELATAMEARCYRGGEGRTRMKQLRFSKADVVVTGIMIVFTAALFWVDKMA